MHVNVDIDCDDKKLGDKDKCRNKCKGLIDKRRCGDGFIWNPSICECKRNKSCDARKHLDYEKCKGGKRLIDKLVLKFEDKVLNSTDTASITDKKVSCKNNCRTYIILLIIMCLILLAIVSISCHCYYTKYWLKGEYSILY